MESTEPQEQGPEAEAPAPTPERSTAPPAAPTPVRAALASAAPASAPAAHAPCQESAPPEATFEVEGARWVVRVLGRSGAGAANTPLLLLGFFRPDDPSAPQREAWAVARNLEALTELHLESAWRAGTPTAPAGERKPFFPEIAGRGAKEG
jgi:hypothetical protein